VVKSAQRVLEILEYFDHDRRSATVMDISRALSYPQSSTSELMRCMARLGYLYFNRSRRTYSPTARVAMLGSWVDTGLFRGGRAVELIDRIAARTGETVALSAGAIDYQLHHIHIVPGANEGAVTAQVGIFEPLLQCPQGELLLASYPDQQIRSAVRRVNADAKDPSQRVNVSEEFQKLASLRDQGWYIGVSSGSRRFGAAAMLLPRRKGTDRLVVSVLATPEVIERDGERILQIMLEERDALLPAEGAARGSFTAQRRNLEPKQIA
jgi:DNA-binding IclR family transcriptional regulator